MKWAIGWQADAMVILCQQKDDTEMTVVRTHEWEQHKPISVMMKAHAERDVRLAELRPFDDRCSKRY